MKLTIRGINFLPRKTSFGFVGALKSILEVTSPKQKSVASLTIDKNKRIDEVVKPKLSILGCRGIPAKYGGFETFAERLSLYLTSIGWVVTVYCQEENSHRQEIWQENWKGIHLVHVPVSGQDAMATIIFDWKSTLHAVRGQDLILTLGYNTAIFCFWYRLKGLVNLINMDGLEWRRKKWKLHDKVWLYINERLGCLFGNHLIADHPELKSYFMNRVPSEKIAVIPYAAEEVFEADASLLKQYDLIPNEYALIIARPEPENSILEIVSAFSSKHQEFKLVVLGRYLPETIAYHKQVMEAASDDVIFLGEIYEPCVTKALRFYTKLYIHGHTVGGTNPSLVEALAAGSPILAHNNRFNCWVAGPGSHYFKEREDCIKKIAQLLNDTEELQRMKQASRRRYQEEFSHPRDLQLYRDLLTKYLPVTLPSR